MSYIAIAFLIFFIVGFAFFAANEFKKAEDEKAEIINGNYASRLSKKADELLKAKIIQSKYDFLAGAHEMQEIFKEFE